jgi:hypothetical protein
MWKKIAIAGGMGAAVLGAGTAALAVAGDTGTPTSATPSSAPSTSAKAAKAHAGRLPARFEHGEWVSKGTSGAQTHDAVRGTVTAVNATSISVRAEDGFTLSFTIGGDTKVVLRENGKGSANTGAISDVKTGQHVVVSGLKTGSTIAAKHLVDTGAK